MVAKMFSTNAFGFSNQKHLLKIIGYFKKRKIKYFLIFDF
jgi:hypothetical protein